MKRICLIDSTYPINTRTNKIYKSLVLRYGKDNVEVIAWNRDGRKTENSEHYHVFEKKAAYGSKIQKLLNLYSFKKFIANTLLNNHFDIIIASHWETLILVTRMHLSTTKIVYDNLDIPTANNKIILKILQCLEKKAIERTEAIVFASRFFVPLYNYYKREKILLENKPDTKISTLPSVQHDDFNIVFLGVIRYFDILKNLIDALAHMENVHLNIWGDGPDFVKLQNYVKTKKNIFIHGRYDNNQLSDIYSTADLIWAVYPNKDYNVRFAISNKFHESIYTCKPCLYASDTELGKYVEKAKIGFSVNPYSVKEIKNTLLKLKKHPEFLVEVENNLKDAQKNASSWSEDFEKIVSFIEQ